MAASLPLSKEELHSRQGPLSADAVHPARPGFEYIPITINYKKSQKFGMLVKNVKRLVIVSSVISGSLCHGVIKEMDQVMEINGTQVFERDACKELIVQSIKDKNLVELLICRPVTKEAVEGVETALNVSLMAPSVTLRSDVVDIQRRFKENLKHVPKKGILLQPGTHLNVNVHISEQPQAVLIGTDVSSRMKELQHVPPKVPSAKVTEHDGKTVVSTVYPDSDIVVKMTESKPETKSQLKPDPPKSAKASSSESKSSEIKSSDSKSSEGKTPNKTSKTNVAEGKAETPKTVEKTKLSSETNVTAPTTPSKSENSVAASRDWSPPSSSSSVAESVKVLKKQSATKSPVVTTPDYRAAKEAKEEKKQISKDEKTKK